MAFTYTELSPAKGVGEAFIVYSYASTGGSTGGAIVTPLSKIDGWVASSATSTPSTYGTISGSTVTITTTANQTGTLIVFGKI